MKIYTKPLKTTIKKHPSQRMSVFMQHQYQLPTSIGRKISSYSTFQTQQDELSCLSGELLPFSLQYRHQVHLW